MVFEYQLKDKSQFLKQAFFIKHSYLFAFKRVKTTKPLYLSGFVCTLRKLNDT